MSGICGLVCICVAFTVLITLESCCQEMEVLGEIYWKISRDGFWFIDLFTYEVLFCLLGCLLSCAYVF